MPVKYLDAATIESYAQVAYSQQNIAVVANGADHSELQKWVGEFFTDVPKAEQSDLDLLKATPSKYYGGEERIAHGAGNTMIIAFPGSSSYTGGSYKPEVAVLAALLGGETTIKWSPGFSLLGKLTNGPIAGLTISTKSAIYSDAGLMYTELNGPATGVAAAASGVAKVLDKVAKGEVSAEDIKKAKALAKFKELEHGQNIQAGLELTGSGLITGQKAYQIDEVAKAIDGVSDAKVKEVSTCRSVNTPEKLLLTFPRRPRSRCSRQRRQ